MTLKTDEKQTDRWRTIQALTRALWADEAKDLPKGSPERKAAFILEKPLLGARARKMLKHLEKNGVEFKYD
jgi:ribosomal protein S25